MTSVAILQARSSSTRLPAKVFLPVAGIPMAILAARRAANTGREVIVATSDDQSDDSLARMIESEGISCFRGSLTNTLERFVNALSSYDDDTIVVRLTADNVVPDGTLIDEMEEFFLSNNLNYLSSVGADSGLPHGVSAEILWLRHLREALNSVPSASDKEHVTPYVARKFGRRVYDKYASLSKGHCHCTVDRLEDYLALRSVFDNASDPEREPFLELVRRIEERPTSVEADTQSLPLIIGGAQFGSSYGITNISGAPSDADVDALINVGLDNGIVEVDTARAYGDSESAIGKALRKVWGDRVRVITKLGNLSDCPSDATQSIVVAFVEASIYRSCRELGRDSLDCVLLHNVPHIDAWNGEVWRALHRLIRQGVVAELGASVQSPDELLRVLRDPLVTVVQMPFNVLDGRWRSAIGELIRTKQNRKVEVHVRSVFLQGLLLTDDPELWARANCNSCDELISWLNEQVERLGRESIADFCLAYVQGQEWVDKVVIGMVDTPQLLENVRLSKMKVMTSTELSEIDSLRPALSESVLNPALWRTA